MSTVARVDSADLVQADIAKKFDGTGAAILVVARADWGAIPQSFIPDFANFSFPYLLHALLR